MRGVLIIIGFVFAWAALYQGIVACGAPPVRDDELVVVTGIVRHVATPLMRNRRVAQALVELETAPARRLEVPVPLEALPLEALSALTGTVITITYAARRPRNRWAYDIVAGDRHLVRLSDQRARDASERRQNLAWMSGLALIAAAVFAAALRPIRPSAESR